METDLQYQGIRSTLLHQCSWQPAARFAAPATRNSFHASLHTHPKPRVCYRSLMDLGALLEQGQTLALAAVLTAALTVEALKALVSRC